MCAVASRGLYHGWGFAELGEHGIAFGLAEMPRLAGLVVEVAREDSERRGRGLVRVVPPMSLPSEAREEAGRAQVLMSAAG